MTTRCTPRKSQPRAIHLLVARTERALWDYSRERGALACVYVAFKGLSTLS